MVQTQEVRGATLSYEVFGDGPDTIIFVHGGGGNWLSWWNQIPRFMDRYRCVTYSVRGFAGSPDHSGEGPRAYARDLGELMDALGIERAALVGQSLGGFSVLPFAAREPARAAAVMMADTIIGVGDADLLGELQTQLAAARAALQDQAANIMVAPGYAEREPSALFLYNQIRGLNPPLRVSGQLGVDEGAASVEELRRATMPVVFLVGAADRLVPPSVVRRAVDLLPNARYVEVAEGGHSVYWELPEAFNAEVERLLAEAFG